MMYDIVITKETREGKNKSLVSSFNNKEMAEMIAKLSASDMDGEYDEFNKGWWTDGGNTLLSISIEEREEINELKIGE